MNRLLLAAAVAAIALVPILASGHAPGVDNHNSCVQRLERPAQRSPTVQVNGTLSYLHPIDRLGCEDPADLVEFGSHAKDCGAGAIAGAYCGPNVLPGVLGGTATCTWFPRFTQLEQVGLIIGFDKGTVTGGAGNGHVRLSEGERPVFGPFRPGTWRVPNPYALEHARVIGYPTNIALPPHPQAGVLSPGDVHDLICVTP